MVLQHWDPFGDLRRVEVMVDRRWRGFGTQSAAERGGDWGIALDVTEDETQLTIRASVPGVAPTDIAVTIEDGVLAIKGRTTAETGQAAGRFMLRERRTGSFSRSVRLPDSVDADRAESTYENGILEITLPKLEASKPKTIEIKRVEAKTGETTAVA